MAKREERRLTGSVFQIGSRAPSASSPRFGLPGCGVPGSRSTDMSFSPVFGRSSMWALL